MITALIADILVAIPCMAAFIIAWAVLVVLGGLVLIPFYLAIYYPVSIICPELRGCVDMEDVSMKAKVVLCTCMSPLIIIFLVWVCGGAIATLILTLEHFFPNL